MLMLPWVLCLSLLVLQVFPSSIPTRGTLLLSCEKKDSFRSENDQKPALEVVAELLATRVIRHETDETNHKNQDNEIRPLRDQGFCNALFDIPSIGAIAKVFSPLAKARMKASGFQMGDIDRLLADKKLGPDILSTSPYGILMSKIQQSALTETQVHSSDALSTLQVVATALARVHAIPIPDQCPNMLWSTLEVMLSMIPKEIAKPYREQVKWHKTTLESLQLPTVLGHGDCKPSNVIVIHGGAKFLDLEVAGRHYRAFDLAKFFRTSQRTKFSRRNQSEFLRAYLLERGGDAKLWTPRELKLESDLLLPMTWLEAAIFFECSRHVDSDQRHIWKQRAEERMRDYWKCMKVHPATLDTYKTFRAKD